jgi:hypothetical protein
MKIKTITCHEVYNYGASLQEYALLYYLNSIGHQAEAIHYKPPYLSKHFKLNAVSNPKYNKPFIKQMYLLAKLPGRLKDLKRKRAFDRFSKKYIPTDNKKYSNNEALKNDVPRADAFICGSDQIWNSFFENGKDPAFYLDFVPENQLKISYAASFATLEIAESIKPFVFEKVSHLDHISVRETSALDILSELGIKNAVQVLDPVFLLDDSHWDKFITPIEGHFVFVYDFDSNPVIKEIALELKREMGYKIYTSSKNINYSDQNYYQVGPETFLTLMRHASFVLTNSFHAVAFSIIFKRQFLVINRTENINIRMRDLLSLFNINERIVVEKPAILKLQEIEYGVLTERLKQEINQSKKYLKSALKS